MKSLLPNQMNFEQLDYLTGCVSCEEATPLVDLKAIFLKNHLHFDPFDLHLPPAASILNLLNWDWLSCESSFSSLRWFMISNCFKSIRSSRSWSFLTIRYERKFNFNDIEDSLIHITCDPFWFFKRFVWPQPEALRKVTSRKSLPVKCILIVMGKGPKILEDLSLIPSHKSL